LPYGIKGVALAGSFVQLAILPWMLHFTFRGTNLTLSRLGQAIVYPLSLGLTGILFAELALHVFAPEQILSQLLVTALGFAAAYSLSALIPRVREEVMSFKDLLRAFGLSREAVEPAAQ